MKLFFLFVWIFLFSGADICSAFVLESFDNMGKFKLNMAKKAKIEIHRVKGIKGAAVRIDFDLRKDHFVEIYKSCEFDFRNVKSFSWYLKGNANGNIIEIKFVDEDGTTFGTKWPISGISENKWKKFTLSMRDLHYMWGGDQEVNNIKNFYIAISRGIARKGYIIIDNFTYVRTDAWEPDFDIQFNQIGYHPDDKKFFILRSFDSLKGKISGRFRIKDRTGNIAVSGNMVNTGFKDWRGLFLKGDFSSLRKEGKYFIEVKLKINGKSYSKRSYGFKIKQQLLAKETLLKELNYIKYQRCGIRCHKNDPVMGGYHDTLFDISKRMWSIPSLVYGMAEYVANGPYHPDADKNGISDDLDELIWGSEFISKIPEPDGTVSWGGIEADFKKFMTYEEFIARIGPLKPEDDKLPRIKYKDKNLYSTSYNTIALVNIAKILQNKKKKLSKRARKVAMTAWNWIDKQPLHSARDYGFYLWVSTEMYKATKNKKYLHRIKEVVPKLLKLQALNYEQFEKYACGDFYTSENQKDFINQYKYVSFNIAINMALINLVKILPQTDDLWFDIYYANRVYGESYLKNMASKTPYKQISLGLELLGGAADDEKWKIGTDAKASLNVDYRKNNIMKFAYDLGDEGNWVQVSKKVPKKDKLAVIMFKYKYKGDRNTLEVKLSDNDGSNFGKKLNLSSFEKWKKVKLKIDNLEYFWGGDKHLNMEGDINLWFAVSKIRGGEGTLLIKDVVFKDLDGNIVKMKFPEKHNLYFTQNYFAGPEAKNAAADNHGLNCDHLGRAYVAMKWGQYIGDLELEEFADNQVNWVLGENPLGYCMLIGAGSKNPIIMAEFFDKPKLAGIIPNGIVGGKNEEPEWWGDGPSSGEDWLPHNAAYFTVLSLIDNPAELTGKVLNGNKVVKNATVKILFNKKLISNLKTDKNGLFKKVNLAPQREYSLIVRKNKNKLVEKISLLSGSKKDIVLNFKQNYMISIFKPRKIRKNKKLNFKFLIKNKNKVNSKVKYVIRIKGGKILSKNTGVVLVKSNKSKKVNIPVIITGEKPFLLRVEIPGNPVLYKEVYLTI